MKYSFDKRQLIWGSIRNLRLISGVERVENRLHKVSWDEQTIHCAPQSTLLSHGRRGEGNHI